MTTIYFIRHDEAENKDRVSYGRMPGFHLDESGKARAVLLGKYFSEKPIAVIFTSPLERSYETANIISSSLPKVPVIHDYDLIEINAAGWQGLPTDQLFKNDIYELVMSNSKAAVPGENLDQVASRMKKVTLKILGNYANKEIICVTHEIPILALKLLLQNQPLENVRNLTAATGSITKLVFNPDQSLAETDYIELQ